MLTDYQWNGTSIYWHRSSCNWLSLFIEMAPKIRGRASLTVMGWPLKTPLMTNVEFNIGECLEHSTKLGNFPSLVISLIALASSAFTSRRTSLGVAIFNRMRVMVLNFLEAETKEHYKCPCFLLEDWMLFTKGGEFIPVKGTFMNVTKTFRVYQ